ncbi:MAG: hypothetical protein ISS47_01385 [Candidatus Omnitrophica bacterium]|nr:hypothetical protein [Candidatus Omnitrophota bacterium]
MFLLDKNFDTFYLPPKINSILKHRMAKDGMAILVVYLTLTVIGILTSTILARSFSLHDMGRYQLILAYVAVGQIAALPGMTVIMTKGILKNYDPIFYVALKRSVLSSTICFFLLFGSGIILHYLQVAKVLSFNLIIVSLLIPLVGLEKHESYFQGKQKFRLSRKIAFFYGLANLFIVGGTAYFTKNLNAVIVALFSLKLTNIIIILSIVNRGLSKQKRDVHIERTLLKQGWQLSGLSVFGVIVGHIDKIILGAIEPGLLAIYYIGRIFPNKINEGVKSLLAVPVSYWAKFSKEENIKKIEQHGLKFFLLGCGCATIIWVIVPWLIPLFYGKDYHESVAIARLVSLILPAAFLGLVVFSIDLYQGDTSFYKKMFISSKFFYLLALAILVPIWGIYGVVASVIIQAYVANGIFLLIYLMMLKKGSKENINKVKLSVEK